MSEVIEVLLADDHPVVRRGLKATIEEDIALRVIAEAADGNEALRQIVALRPAVRPERSKSGMACLPALRRAT